MQLISLLLPPSLLEDNYGEQPAYCAGGQNRQPDRSEILDSGIGRCHPPPRSLAGHNRWLCRRLPCLLLDFPGS